MRLAALLSGGKDSMYSLYTEMKNGHEIKLIISFHSENDESYMFHTPNIHLVETQAELLGVPHIRIPTKGIKEEELQDIRQALLDHRDKIDGIVTGATASTYQKSRIDAICANLGLASLAPLWQADPASTLRSMIADGFEIIIVAVGAPPLDQAWLGRHVDEQCIQDLQRLHDKYGIHMLFEGGEAESFVLDCPLFSKKITVVSAEPHWDPKTRSGKLAILKIRTDSKQ